MRLILMRHPPVASGSGLCYGRLDLPCDSAAIDASVAALDGWRGLPVYSSPAQRCLALAGRLAAPPIVWPSLQELDFGTWEGRRWDDIARSEIDAWAADIWHYRPGGGENAAMLRSRWHEAIAGWRLAAPEAAIVVTHAGPIRMALAEAGQLGAAERWSAPIAHARPYILEL
ncbi:histidine phosphatase family protein [Chitinivorax sp. PXF-14]|uniref:histidine phosphatase family protein n=1 Tax=Chitinivorax sp. PXF-14 TaxID=3230488 RepID=UPI00346551BF